MKNLFIVGNWKENKTESEAINFLMDFAKSYSPRPDVKTIICPTYLSVSAASKFVKENNLDIDLGVQEVSEFEGGAYTGEVSASQAAEFVKYSIIGHSERRKNFNETDQDIEKKVKAAADHGIIPIVCVINDTVPVPVGVRIVAYEPVEAIGTGHPDTPENAEEVAKKIKEKNPDVTDILYGGSVTSENVRSFTEKPDISGVLVGGASLDPAKFLEIISKC